MNRFKPIYSIILTLLVLMLFSPLKAADALVLKSRYATITYSDYNDLKEFNYELYMGRLRPQIKKTGADTIAEEVVAKINFIVEKVMIVLDMFPPRLRFSIVICPNAKQVQKHFHKIYDIDVDYMAFFSPSRNTVFYSADNANIRVVAHEIGHVVVAHYFKIPPPQRIHELLAQFAAKHVTD